MSGEINQLKLFVFRDFYKSRIFVILGVKINRNHV